MERKILIKSNINEIPRIFASKFLTNLEKTRWGGITKQQVEILLSNDNYIDEWRKIKDEAVWYGKNNEEWHILQEIDGSVYLINYDQEF